MKQMKKLLAFVLAFAMIITIYQPSAVYAAAKKPGLSAKTMTLQVGQKKTLKVKNAGKKAKLKWSSNKKSIATVSQKGVVKAVKAGNAVVTCKVTTKNGKTTKLTCKVAVKKTAKVTSLTVGSQSELEKALKNKNVTKITVATQGAVTFTVPQGDYSKVDLVINAPNADVVNNGKFKSIDIQAIKPNTYHENATGNTILFRSKDGRIVIEKNASGVSITLTPDGETAHFEIYGGVTSITVNGPANIIIEGNVSSAVPVKLGEKAAGATVTSSIPVDVKTKADVSLTLTRGAEGSKVEAADKTEVTVKNETTSAISVVTTAGAKDISANSTSKVDANGNVSETIMDNNGGGSSSSGESGGGSSSSGSTDDGSDVPRTYGPIIISTLRNSVVVELQPGYEYACAVSGTAISEIPQSDWTSESELEPDNYFRTIEYSDLDTCGEYVFYRRSATDKKYYGMIYQKLEENFPRYFLQYKVDGPTTIDLETVSTGSAISVPLEGIHVETYGSDDDWEDLSDGFYIESNGHPELEDVLTVREDNDGKVKLYIDFPQNPNWSMGENTIRFDLSYEICEEDTYQGMRSDKVSYTIRFNAN